MSVTKISVPQIRFNSRPLRLSWANSISFKVLLTMIVASTFVFYIVQANTISTQGFKTKDIEKRITRLKEQNQALELEAADLQSNSKIQSRIDSLKMVAVDKVDYISPTAEMVAMK